MSTLKTHRAHPYLSTGRRTVTEIHRPTHNVDRRVGGKGRAKKSAGKRA